GASSAATAVYSSSGLPAITHICLRGTPLDPPRAGIRPSTRITDRHRLLGSRGGAGEGRISRGTHRWPLSRSTALKWTTPIGSTTLRSVRPPAHRRTTYP